MIGWALACGGAAIVGAGYFAPGLQRAAGESGIRRRLREGKYLVLTFDDGPGLWLTPKVLDLLAAHGARATFFLIGSRAESCPQMADRIVASGHEVGCHTYAHQNAWKVLPWRAAGDVAKGYQALARWVPADGMFRPPFGKLSAATWWGLRKRRAPIVWWTLDSGDTAAQMPEPAAVAESLARDGGGIVLLHDFDRSQERMDFVLRTTELLLQTARREGMRVCGVRESGVLAG